VRLDLELERGLELRCRIVDERGQPLANLPVFVARIADESAGTTYGARGPFRTDGEGRFVVPNCADALYQLDIRHARFDRSLPSPAARGLRPGPEHDITVAYEDPPSAALRGLILDDAGRPLAHARVDLVHPGGGSERIAASDADGRFHAEGLEPGTFGLWIRARDYPYIELAPREFTAGETLDVGTLQVKTPGFLDVTLRSFDGAPVPDELWDVDLFHPDGTTCWIRFAVELGVAHSDPLEPGEYLLRVAGAEDRPVQVEAGVTHALAVVRLVPK
jgi:hypothetical protein